MTDSQPIIDADLAQFMQRGISLNIGSSGPDLRPSVARALGCVVSDDRRSVRMLVSATQSASVIEHVRGTQRLAAVFSEPPTHRTYQLKGSDAQVQRATDADLAVVRRYRHAFVRELEQMGYPPKLIYGFLHCPDTDIVAIAFTPTAGFSQTPRPKAGQALGAQP